jgi:hypothetical protein
MTLALAFLFPPGILDTAAPAPAGGKLLWEDSFFIALEDGAGYLALE